MIVGISKSSVQRALKRFEERGDFYDRPRSGRPKKLNDRNKTRLDWCLEHSNWTIDDWKRVIFSDETAFYIIKRKKEVKIWRTKNERWKEGCMHVAAVGGGGRVNFWGAITAEGTGCFRIYTENTNSDVYCGILENYLIPTMQLYQMENNYIYQDDNFRYHVSRQTQTKLRELGVQSLEWPAKSPDLNVIEHLWSIIDDQLNALPMSSVQELTEALSSIWLSIKPQL
ncbi:unnamed protein product, partial [Rotaria sordida]